MKRKYEHWYKTANVKHVAAFLRPHDYLILKRLASEADKSLTRYVTRLLEKHIQEKEKENPSNS